VNDLGDVLEYVNEWRGPGALAKLNGIFLSPTPFRKIMGRRMPRKSPR
jgi:hypothetical protein